MLDGSCLTDHPKYDQNEHAIQLGEGSGASLRGARVKKDPAIGLGFSKTDRRIGLRQNVTRNLIIFDEGDLR